MQLSPPATSRTIAHRPALRVLSAAACLLALLPCLAGLADEPATTKATSHAEKAKAAFEQTVRPLLSTHCTNCHGPKKQEAGLRIDTLNPDLLDGPDAETWHDVLNRLNLGEMPPEDAKQLPDAEHQSLVAWLTGELRRAVAHRRGSGGDVVLRRLTRYEYHNTMRDLLGIELNYARDLPPEPPSNDGFRNNGAALGISPLQMELYWKTARDALEKAIVLGPQPERFTHRAEKSEKVRRVKGEVSSTLRSNDRFLVRMNEFPRQGEVLVRVEAFAAWPQDAAPPRMRIAMGVRADVQAPEKTLAEVEVAAPAMDPAVFEFHGRIEDFPLPGHNPKYPGLQITIYNASGKTGAKPKKKPKNKNGEQPAVSIENPTEPLVHIKSVEFIGPLFESWPPPSHTRILFASDNQDDETRYAREVLQRFLTRAYRRPASDSDVDAMMAIFERLRPQYPTIEETFREVLAMALISPDFLYLVETRSDPAKPERLNDFELASRLSYFLWSTMPDDELMALARRRQLQDLQVLESQIARMLADPRSREFVAHFTEQWFDLPALERVAVNPEFHPGFDDRLKADMREETQRFFAAILDEDLSCLNLLDSDFTWLNRQLAEHYGIKGPRLDRFQRVALRPEDRRGGLLTQGSFLLANSNGEQSHPIKRAVWLLDRLLDDPPAPPPPDVPELDPSEPDLAGLSLKRQLEVHRRKAACNNCHRGIDPWGVALEHYDAVGQWRESLAERRKAKSNNSKKKNRKVDEQTDDAADDGIDATVELPDGRQVDGLGGLKAYLLAHKKRQFAQAVVKRLLTYSLGRSLDLSDRAELETLTRRFEESDYRLRPLISAIVQSEPFQTK